MPFGQNFRWKGILFNKKHPLFKNELIRALQNKPLAVREIYAWIIEFSETIYFPHIAIDW